jgi:hypothetical protein
VGEGVEWVEKNANPGRNYSHPGKLLILTPEKPVSTAKTPPVASRFFHGRSEGQVTKRIKTLIKIKKELYDALDY